jgi:hypothetical protein
LTIRATLRRWAGGVCGCVRRGRTRDEVEWGTEWDGWLAFDAVLEFGHKSGEVDEDPGVDVGVFDGFAFLGVDEEVDDTRRGYRVE